MDKIEVFKNIYGNLKKLKQLKISQRQELKGNLAFFVEYYYGTDKWDAMIEELKGYVEKKDMNEVCWFLSTNICTGFEDKYASKDYVWIS